MDDKLKILLTLLKVVIICQTLASKVMQKRWKIIKYHKFIIVLYYYKFLAKSLAMITQFLQMSIYKISMLF